MTRSETETQARDEDFLSWGKTVLEKEGQSLLAASSFLGPSFVRAAKAILKVKGKLALCGLGKSGYVAAKTAATFSSTGTPAFYIHPGEGLHGDFGMLSKEDLLLAFAHGGETREVLALVAYAKKLGLPVIGVSGKADSRLAKEADIFLETFVAEEADSLGLAPTCSSNLAMAMGDALAVSLMRARNFSLNDFASLHPGGSLGRSLLYVGELMHKREELKCLREDSDFNAVLEGVTKPNFGIVAVLDEQKKLLGSISDGDSRRKLLELGAGALKLRAKDMMNKKAKTTQTEERALEALAKMEEHKITSLFVCKENGEFLGLLRLHDLLSAKVI